MAIKVNNVSFEYKKQSDFAIDNLTCEIHQSTINVILGLNGCGKTTFIKLLVGLLETKNGNIEYDGKKLSSLSVYERSKLFAYVSQKQNTSDFLVRDYLACGFVNTLSFFKKPTKEQIGNMEKTAESLGILRLLSKKIGEISGGEYQLVSIVAAVLQNTPYIICDEPMSALDMKNQTLVMDMLNKISREGKTIILSTHNPNHALKLNANVILMKKGKIIKTGKSDEILNVENLKEIYGEKVCFADDLPYKEISMK